MLKILRWPMAVLLLHLIVTYTGLYWQWLKLDNLMHFLGGASIGIAGVILLSSFTISNSDQNERVLKVGTVKNSSLNISPFWLRILLTVALVALAAALWEFMELGIDFFFSVKMQPDLLDTMSDIALGLFGGLISAGVKLAKLETRN